jgi:hypothetical protein
MVFTILCFLVDEKIILNVLACSSVIMYLLILKILLVTLKGTILTLKIHFKEVNKKLIIVKYSVKLLKDLEKIIAYPYTESTDKNLGLQQISIS